MMQTTNNHTDTPRAGRDSLLLISVILVLVGVFLYGYVEKSYNDYVASQQALMTQSTQGTTQLISLFLKETRQRVHLFAEEESSLISSLASNPGDDDQRMQLSDKLKRHFPDYFAYSIASDDGDTLLDDFDGKVEAVCQADIKAFAERHDYMGVFIHPNPAGYHFDIMAHWQDLDGGSGIFFISFHATILAQILANNQLHNHQLLLLHRDQPGLIEVTAAGSRLKLQREFLLSPDEMARIQIATEVDGSRWSLADLPATDLFVQKRNMLRTHAVSIFLVFLLFSSLMYWLIVKREQKLNMYREHLEVLNRDLSHSLQQLREDAEAGRKIQRQFLPETQQRFGDYSFSQHLFPSMYLSGDFVDFFSIDDNRVGFYIADVSGHGAASAFVTVMLKTLINQYREAYRQKKDETICHPANVLQRLNRDMHRQNLGKFATIFYGVIDRSEDQMVFSAGAQFPYPIMLNGGKAHFLKYKGRPVGMFDNSRFEEHTLKLPDEFAFYLVSDGLLELLPQSSLQEKFDILIKHVTDAGPSLDDFIAGFGLDETAEYPDDITVFKIDRQSSHV